MTWLIACLLVLFFGYCMYAAWLLPTVEDV